MSGTLDIELADGIHGPRRAEIVGLLRERSEAGSKIVLTTHNLSGFLEAARKPKDPIEAADRLLLYIANKARTFSAPVKLVKADYPIVYGEDHEDLAYVQTHLREQGLIEQVQGGQGGQRLTPAGWERIRAIRTATPDTNQAFVAMWFASEMQPAWTHGFTPGLKTAGFEPLRVDLVEHNDKICDRIIVEIRRSSLVVADVTGGRGGVYFEAGYAMGLGLPVIWTARESDFEAHFDTRQFNHILWSDPADLAAKLSQRVLATVGTPLRSAL